MRMRTKILSPRMRTGSRIGLWVTLIDSEKFDIEKFANSLVKAGREAVEWERRKLDWILEEKKTKQESTSEVA